jgi:glutaredoxin
MRGSQGVRRLIFLVLLGLLFTVVVGQAEIYRYLDDKGATVFVDDPAKVPKKHRAKMTVADGSSVNLVEVPPAHEYRPSRPKVASPASLVGPVELYVTSWCGYCKKLEQALSEKGVQFLRYDIEKDAEAHRRFKEYGGAGVPLASVGGKIVRGYNPDKVLQLLKQ